jgi:hypothetical protein
MNPPARTVPGPHLPSSHVPCLSAACLRASLPGCRRLPPLPGCRRLPPPPVAPLSLCVTVQTTPLFLLSSYYCRVGSPISLPLSASSADRRAQAPPSPPFPQNAHAWHFSVLPFASRPHPTVGAIVTSPDSKQLPPLSLFLGELPPSTAFTYFPRYLTLLLPLLMV